MKKQSQFQIKSIVYRFKRFAKKAYSTFNSINRVVSIGVVSGYVLTFAHVGTISAQTTINSEDIQDKISEKELNEVTVTASRVNLSINQTAKLVTIITRDEIQRAPVQSIQDLLNYAAGVDVQQRGGHGVQSDISIRGGSFDQTAILLNGVNLSNPQTGHYSFDIPINLSDIDHIEIIYGPSSIIYGASAFSGGINIVTKKYPDHIAYGEIQVGEHELVNMNTGGAFKTKNLSNQLSLGYSSSDGYINNSDYDILNLLWQSRLDIEKSIIDIQLGYNDKRYGANTFYSAIYPNQYDKTRSYLTSIKAETGDKLKFIPQVYWNRHHDRFELIRGGSSNYHRTDVYGSNLNLQYSSKYGITSLGAELRNESILSNVLGKEMNKPEGKYTKSDDRTNISYALEHNLILDKITMTVGLLTNYNTSLNGKYKIYPSINLNYKFINNWKVYISWSKATRMPTFTDLYYTQATHIGNSRLKPERTESFEIGFKYTNYFLSAYITGYITDGKNLIDWVKDKPEDKWRSENLTKINKKGIELGSKISFEEIDPFFKNTILQLGYTRLHQNKNSNELISNYVLNYLRDKFTSQLRHPIYKNVSANWSFRWQKRMGTYLKYENLKPTSQKTYPTFSTLDLKIDWKLKDFDINLTANNIFDKKYFDLGNIPQAGFWLIGGISYTIR